MKRSCTSSKGTPGALSNLCTSASKNCSAQFSQTATILPHGSCRGRVQRERRSGFG